MASRKSGEGRREPGAEAKAGVKPAGAGRKAPALSKTAWEKRVASPAFEAALRGLIKGEIEAIARERVGDVIDGRRVRERIAERAPTLVEAGVIVDLAECVREAVIGELRRRNESLLGLVDSKLAATVEAMLDEKPVLSEPMQEFIAGLMRQEFVQALFTDIVYTSIKSFNERVNPLSRFTVGLLEDQIKSFLRLFMPMLQQEATSFATSKENQEILFSFTGAIVKSLLEEPLPNLFDMLSAGQRKQAGRLIRQALEDRKLDKLASEMALAIWDALYANVRHRKLGELFLLKENARWLADRAVEAILPVLRRPGVLRFVENEVAALAAGGRT